MSKTYTTVQGDMFDSIAYNEYGSCGYADKIMWANRQYLDYLTFPAGIELTLPDIETETVSGNLPPWKKVSSG